MRKFTVAGAVAALVGCLFAVAPAGHAENIGNQGCTPGYWKNHTDNWFEDAANQVPIPTTRKLSVAGFVTSPQFANTTLLQALSLKGGPSLLDAEALLLHHAAAAWLNAAHEGVGYPYRRFTDPFNITATVNAAIASGDRATMLAVKDQLDAANNLGCPLN